MAPPVKPISINAFYANTPGQGWMGLWSHPESRAREYTQLDYWVETARLAERGLFDSIFFADTSGVFDVFGASARAAIERAAMFPMNDPNLLIPAMAHATRDLSFGVTGNLTYEPPFLLARRFSTLDHLTRGRIAWNIVTGFQDSAARAMGLASQREHDARYDVADEYMDVVYKLWETSWDDDAVVRDAANRIYARGDRVRAVHHAGQHYRMSGVHLSEPSPQRTPVLYQAGGSPRGQAFAARHAECIFLSSLPKPKTGERGRAIRKLAAASGRDPAELRFIAMATVVVGRSSAEARDKRDAIQAHLDLEGMLAAYSGMTGLDFSKLAPDDPIAGIANDGIRSVLEALASGGRRVRDIAHFGPGGGRECFVVGSPAEVADQLEAWMDEAEIDGFNLLRTVEPGHLADVVELVVPELQNRGRYKSAYTPGTFRNKLFGKGDRLARRW